MVSQKNWIQPTWPAPPAIHAYTTLRQGGISSPPYATWNLADHVGDDRWCVSENRKRLVETLGLPSEPIWIRQTHSAIALPAEPGSRYQEADATFTDQPNQVCLVLTADCLPILVCNRQGTHVAAIHAGWKGLANGVIASTLNAMNQSPNDLLVWLGPAISQKNYPVSDDLRQIFLKQDPRHEDAFIQHQKQWHADLYQIARHQFAAYAVNAITGGNHCTFAESNDFYSYRRDGEKSGRIATLIWRTAV